MSIVNHLFAIVHDSFAKVDVRYIQNDALPGNPGCSAFEGGAIPMAEIRGGGVRALQEFEHGLLG
jgi:hypothetical protein